jgi:hypothetical protein
VYARAVELDPLRLADLQARALFVHDERDRLVAVHDLGGGCAPWALLIRTAAGTLVRFREGAPEGLVAEAAEFATGLAPHPPDAAGRDGTLDALAGLVGKHVEVTRRWAGPAYVFPEPLFPSAGAIQLYPANAVMLHPELATWGPELRQRRPCFAVLRGGQAIAICASSRKSAGAAEAGVETVSAFRGQGAAGLAVAAWAAAVRESGRVPFYSTSWENAASLAVARKLGLELFGEDVHVG